MPARHRQPIDTQVADLQARLSEAEETLNAIRSGSIDALVVRTPKGEQLFTLKGADQTYRALVEAMNEGAVTLTRDTISYSNRHFAKLARARLHNIIGQSIFKLIPSAEFRRLLQQLQRGERNRSSLEAILRTSTGTEVPILLAACRFDSDGKTSIGLVVTDITQRKEIERARHEISRRILNAQELERQRVARDLHDGVNQLLSSTKYRLSNCSQQCSGELQKNLSMALHLVEKAIAEVRVISRNLRPSELDDLGLPAALRSLVQEFEKQNGICVRFEGNGYAQLPAEVDLALYRITQEALNNIANHSKATRADVALGAIESRVVLTIRDNGRGLPKSSANQKGWGLKNMRARASLLGGTFAIQAAAGGGTRVEVTMPVANGSKGVH